MERSRNESGPERGSGDGVRASLPGPSLPPEAQARLWMERPTELLESCRASHGEFFLLRLGHAGAIAIAADPQAVRAIFELPDDAYECRPFNESYRYVMGDEALFLQDGRAHRELKRLLAPHFGPAALTAQQAVVAQEARAAFRALAPGENLRLRPFVNRLTLRCLLRLVLGEGETGRRAVERLFEESVWRDLRAWKPWTAISRLHPVLRRLLGEEIARRRAAPGAHDDLLAALAAARTASGAPLPQRVIEDQILMLLVTAGDAVAVAAAWALERLARAPEVQRTLREARADGEAEADDRYLQAVVQEILRLHPVLPTVSGRRLAAEREIAGHAVPEGVSLAPCGYLAHRRAEAFEDPLAFRPERFLNRRYPSEVYFPFGGGARACLGARLAPMTVRAAALAAAETVRLAPGAEAPRTVRMGTLLAPAEAAEIHVVSKHAAREVSSAHA